MRIGIAGYGNLGIALEIAAGHAKDVEVVGVFTRREARVVTRYAPVFSIEELSRFRGAIDVLAVCYGSSSDLPRCTPEFTEYFNTVDSYDNHNKIEIHKKNVGRIAESTRHTSLVSLGWDPGLLSLFRLYLGGFIPFCTPNTFWGRGVSQGHSEALSRIDGVRRAVQYTVPKDEALTLAGLVGHHIDEHDRHKRVCYIAAEKNKEDLITEEVLSMKNYFYGYETELRFVSENDPVFENRSMSHRGRIYALGSSGEYRENKHVAYFDLEIGSNPDLTAHIMLTGMRVCRLLAERGRYGAFTVFDLEPSLFAEAAGRGIYEYL